MSDKGGIANWIEHNRLKTIGGVWGGALAGSMAYQWSRNIPTQMKIIHSRVYAQGVTLAALIAASIAHLMKEETEEVPNKATS